MFEQTINNDNRAFWLEPQYVRVAIEDVLQLVPEHTTVVHFSDNWTEPSESYNVGVPSLWTRLDSEERAGLIGTNIATLQEHNLLDCGEEENVGDVSVEVDEQLVQQLLADLVRKSLPESLLVIFLAYCFAGRNARRVIKRGFSYIFTMEKHINRLGRKRRK